MRNNWQIWNPVKVGRAKGPSPSHRTDATTTLFGKMAHEPGGPPTSSREPGGPATRSSPGNGNYAKAAADECRICYERYDQRGRRARLLACLHRVCAKCLRRMLDVGQSSLSPCVVTCPFCRGKTSVPPEEVTLAGSFPFLPASTKEWRFSSLVWPGVGDGGRARRTSGPSGVRERGGVAGSRRRPPDHRGGAAVGVALSERRRGRGAVPAGRPGLAGQGRRPYAGGPPRAPLPAGGAVSGVLGLPAGGHLPADAGAHLARRPSGGPGPVHVAPAAAVRLLRLPVPAAPGGAGRPSPGLPPSTGGRHHGIRCPLAPVAAIFFRSAPETSHAPPSLESKCCQR
ncbi:uncharacterized protein LOC144202568 isoform X1 [Stigmatopora nigra]